MSADGFFPGSLEDYVKHKGGKKVINKVLIANNGLGATKAIRFMKKWCFETFGDSNVVKFVVMPTPEDIKINAEFIHLADEFIQVPGGSNNNNYANIQLIVKIAERCKADAVWPGWGHASENPLLPDALAKRGITWIGPPPSAMRALGDKIGSTLIAQSSGVSCMPWSGMGLKVDYNKSGIPDDIYKKCCVTTPEECLAAALKIGFPVMIKASEGGGGKGVRKCQKADEIEMAFRQCCGEVPGSPIFLMQLAPICRHLEVQLLADEWGDAIAILGRDCSIQRRYQKIIEEGPVLGAPPHVWRKMEKAAVALAKEVGYCGVGTVEYLFYGNEDYCFLELNPRLQVEHPVTEGISGTNLPAAQLQVAMGIPLHQIKDIRAFFGADPLANSRIDFDNTEPVAVPGHVIACRITAENASEGFQPTSGNVETLNFRSLPGVWGYFSISADGGIHEFADSQFGHVFSHGATREDARRKMLLALKELAIRGEIRNTVEYLMTILSTDDFIHNRISTSWLEWLMAKEDVKADSPPDALAVLLGAAYKAQTFFSTNLKDYTSTLERGQLPSPQQHEALVSNDSVLIYNDVKYTCSVFKSGAQTLDIVLNDSTFGVEVVELADGGMLVLLDGKKHVVYGIESPSGLRLTVDGMTCLFANEYDPTRLCAAMQGKLVRFLAEEGAHVTKGAPFAEVEVMKMFVTLTAPESGILTPLWPEGSTMEAGDLLASMTLDDPDKVKKAEDFTGSFPALGTPRPLGDVSATLQAASDVLTRLLEGFKAAPGGADVSLQTLMNCLRNPSLPLLQFNELASPLSGRIPPGLWEEFQAIANRYQTSLETSTFHWETRSQFPAVELQQAVARAVAALPAAADKIALAAQIDAAGVTDLLARYAGGNHTYAVGVLTSLLDQYYEVESLFNGRSLEEVINELRKGKNDITVVSKYARAHHALADRTHLVIAVLQVIENDLSPLLGEFLPAVTRMSKLNAGSTYGRLSLTTRQMIMRHEMPGEEEKLLTARAIMNSCIGASGASLQDRLTPLLDATETIDDIMYRVLAQDKASMQKVAMEVLIRRVYTSYSIKELNVDGTADGGVLGTWRLHCKDANRKDTKDLRSGMVTYHRSFESMQSGFAGVVDKFGKLPTSPGGNILYVITRWPLATSDEDKAAILGSLVQQHQKTLTAKALRRVTFVVHHSDTERPSYLTFRAEPSLHEDVLMRNIEPCWAINQELGRLASFDISYVPTKGYDDTCYLFAGKVPVTKGRPEPDRLFARVVLRSLQNRQIFHDARGAPQLELALVDTLNNIEIALGGDVKYKNNHIFINVLAPVSSLDLMHKAVRHLARTYAEKLGQLEVKSMEFALTIQDQKYRIYYHNPTGYMLIPTTYLEVADAKTGVAKHQVVVDSKAKEWVNDLEQTPFFDGQDVLAPYPVYQPFQKQRALAHAVRTAYVYDFLSLIEKAVATQWRQYLPEAKRPAVLVQAAELIINSADRDSILETTRAPGQNDVGMVAWRLTLFTPFAAEGRDVVIIANDITFQMGTFGTEEDRLFDLASKYARKLGIPRLYFSANSGARIGLAAEIQAKFRVAFVDDEPTKGFSYIYLTAGDYAELSKSVTATKITDGGETRYRITDIIGATHGLGVENLSGSGKIAGETSKAYEDVFTLTYITGRSVGIGAYLARLGQRCIQKDSEAILLTGFQALNKLLGRAVYSSNLQLGGNDIMYTNGVTHLTVKTDLEGMTSCLEWLNYVPKFRGGALPVHPALADPVDRAIGFCPTNSPYDCRDLLAGVQRGDDWVSGFFDKGSFMEVLGGWAKTVVAGRARLGGLPLGVVAVGTSTVEQITPADPADPESKERVKQMAGQVWFPDSAFKTAQAIEDMIAEDLPLMIFANWRGFSGGQQDMFDEVLKYGSYIVDKLRVYKQPVMVYIPPLGTLRGGAWVVVDSTINEQYMEMYAAETARGGVLEVEGIVSIKFRMPQLVAAMHRNDAKLQALDRELAAATVKPMTPAKPAAKKSSKKKGSKKGARSNEKAAPAATAVAASGRPVADIKADIKQRETLLAPYYHTVSTAFADMHDTPGRMLAKEVIRACVPWAEARSYFYWRLRRRLAETSLVREVQGADASLSEDWKAARAVVEGIVDKKVLGDDKAFATWVETNAAAVTAKLAAFADEAAVKEITAKFQGMSPAARAKLMKALVGASK